MAETPYVVGQNEPPFAPALSGSKYVPDSELMARIGKAWEAVGAKVALRIDEMVGTDRGSRIAAIRSDLVNGMPRG